jgi:hypothetical protein
MNVEIEAGGRPLRRGPARLRSAARRHQPDGPGAASQAGLHGVRHPLRELFRRLGRRSISSRLIETPPATRPRVRRYQRFKIFPGFATGREDHRASAETEDDAVAAAANQVVCNRVIAFVSGPRVRSR